MPDGQERVAASNRGRTEIALEESRSAKPRLLDLFCGAGGCTKGYQRAGFHVVGVDIRPQPRYCGDEFFQDDALWLESLCGYTEPFDAVHASPPCQDYSKALRHLSNEQPRLIEPVRDLLRRMDLPWVLENVPGAPLPTQDTLDGRYGVQLCGTMFGMRVYRHRLFETSFPVVPPPRGCNHSVPALNPYNQKSRERDGIESGAERAFASEMGVEWMSGKRGELKSEIGEAVPPAYTEFIGKQLYWQVVAGRLEREAAA